MAAAAADGDSDPLAEGPVPWMAGWMDVWNGVVGARDI